MRSAGSRSWRSTPIARPPGSGGCPSSGPAGPGGGRCARSARASRRSGERRVGEEGRSRGAPGHLKKKKKNCLIYLLSGYFTVLLYYIISIIYIFLMLFLFTSLSVIYTVLVVFVLFTCCLGTSYVVG